MMSALHLRFCSILLVLLLPWGTEAAGSDAALVATPEQSRWWAFQPLRAPVLPRVSTGNAYHSEVDRFLQVERERRGLSPAPPAERRVLLRRVTLDLTGLPPTPEEVEDFLSDSSPDAYARVVDRLLASPTHGQRWARHWLDVVRYADYHDGNPKARNPVCEPLEAWRYRDWVVRSLNRDLSFDQFVTHQIAGDLLPSPDGQVPYGDGLIATTFLVNGAWDRGDADKEKMVSDMVDDQIDTIGKAFLGLTLGCARCHNHKFDPISQKDYYALAGIFYSTRMLKELGTKGGEITLQRRPLAAQEQVERRERQVKEIESLTAQLTMWDKKDPKFPNNDPGRLRLLRRRDELQKALIPEPPMTLAVSEGGVPGSLFPGIQDVPLHIRGSYTRLGPIVPRGVPRFFAGESPTSIREGSGRRELARWILSQENPLTARVIVNRVWQWHFGVGLVRTPNNFGLLSESPSHPELLDWLAVRFRDEGWSLKTLHRRIVLSSAYQQSSVVTPDQQLRDPENRWVTRYSRRRLEAETLRDAMLRVAGRLELASDGPATHDLMTARRSLYVQTARWDRSNFATLFDAANPDASVEKRDVSTVAPQALFLLNNEFVLTQARSLAQRCLREGSTEVDERIQRLFRWAFNRHPSEEELAVARRLLSTLEPEGPATAWQELAHVLLCSNEFASLD